MINSIFAITILVTTIAVGIFWMLEFHKKGTPSLVEIAATIAGILIMFVCLKNIDRSPIALGAVLGIIQLCIWSRGVFKSRQLSAPRR